MRRCHPFAITLALLPLLGACASPQRPAAAGPAAVVEPRNVPVFHGDSGSSATLDEVITAASATDVVVIGENHGHPAGLATADVIWRGVLERSPNSALSMEFFERDEQVALDNYLTGVTNESRFKKAAGRNDDNYPPGHRAMIEAAKSKNRPVIAANAPRIYVSLARSEGYDRLTALTPEQRRLFRIPDVIPSGRYRQDFDAVMNGMAPEGTVMDDERRAHLDAAFRSQSLWDWTMADSVSRCVSQGNAPIVHVIGRFHTDFEGGTIQALRLLRPGIRILTISFVDQSSTTLREEDRNRADFVLYAGTAE